MKTFYSIILSFIFLSLNAEMTCYRTILINEKKVESGPISWRNLSTIEEGESSSFYSLENKKPLNHKLFVLFTGFEKPWYGYHSFVTFKDLGTWKIDGDNISYFIDTDVLIEENYRLRKVDHRVQLDYVSQNGFVIGKVSYESRYRNMSGEKSFKLQKVDCPQDMP